MLYINILSFPEKSFLFSIPYILLAIITAIVLKDGEGYNKNNTKSNVFLMAINVIFWGLRWHIMSDSLAYEEQFYNIKPLLSYSNIEESSAWWDEGFVLFAIVTKQIFNNFQFFVFVNTLVDVILFCICLRRYSNNWLITILAFYAFNGILIEINLFRNIKSILLFVLSIQYIKERNLLKFLSINIIGFYFHSSALLFFPFYWILNKEYKLKFLICLSIISSILYVFSINVLQDYLADYIYILSKASAENKMSFYLETAESTVLTIGTIERILTLILILYVYSKTEEKDKYFIIFSNCYFAFFVLYSLFGFNEVLRDRIPNLFYFSYWFVYPYIYAFFKEIKPIKYGFYLLFFLKIYTSTSMCSAYYENIMFETTTRKQRMILLEKCN